MENGGNECTSELYEKGSVVKEQELVTHLCFQDLKQPTQYCDIIS